MRKIAFGTVTIFAALLIMAGCGDSEKKDDAGKKDGVTTKFDSGSGGDGVITLPEGGAGEGVIKPDMPPTTVCDKNIIGKACTETGGECGASHICLPTSKTLGGVCTCQCTPDDPGTPLVNEDNCPEPNQTNVCAKIPLEGGSSENLCLQLCKPQHGTNTCQGKLACNPRAGSAVSLWGKTVCLFHGCQTNEDCPVVTNVVCSVAANDCSSVANSKCITYSGGDEGRCALQGNCDTASGLCKAHDKGNASAVVGSGCTDDRDCAGNMSCMSEYDKAATEKKEGATCTDDSECCSGVCSSGVCTKGLCPVMFRNGYCVITGCTYGTTLTEKACPAGAACNDLYTAGMCQKSCTMDGATDCRGNANDLYGDYECRQWGNLQIGGKPLATAPVCDFGPIMSCDFLKASKLDCSAVGSDETGKTNPTNMVCRDLAGTATADAFDPLGFCLDDTASGTNKRNPLPTP